MIIDCIGCLHGARPDLKGGDLLIITGDLTLNDTLAQINRFKDWLIEVATPLYKKTVMIAGNHDNWIQRREFFNRDRDCWEHESHSYLEDSGTGFEGLKIWGSPWTLRFPGMNPKCCAFTVDTEKELSEKWALIPDDTDILITHCPSFGNLDITDQGESVGSLSLWMKLLIVRPKIHAFSHVHESYEYAVHYNGIRLANCSIMNGHYQPVNAPIRIELSDQDFPSSG